MLSVQSVNFKPAFGNYKYADVKDVEYEAVNDMPSDEYYSKVAYEKDKSALEKQLDDINEVIENTDVPKPLRAIGKLATIGIGAALGFVSMKYGAQGVAKMLKKGAGWVKTLGEKKFVKNISEKIQNFWTNITKSKTAQKISSPLNDILERPKVKSMAEKLRLAQIKKMATAENVEKGAVNLFAVSGGVTGGVTALQEVTKD